MTAGRRAGMRYKKAGKTSDQQWIMLIKKKVKRQSRKVLFFIRSELWAMMEHGYQSIKSKEEGGKQQR
jgi:hypothetical protein